MPRKRFSVEQIINHLREAEVTRPAVKLFTPDAQATWLIADMDPDDPDRLLGDPGPDGVPNCSEGTWLAILDVKLGSASPNLINGSKRISPKPDNAWKRCQISDKGLSGNHFAELPRSILSGWNTRQRCYLETVES